MRLKRTIRLFFAVFLTSLIFQLGWVQLNAGAADASPAIPPPSANEDEFPCTLKSPPLSNEGEITFQIGGSEFGSGTDRPIYDFGHYYYDIDSYAPSGLIMTG